MSLDGKLAYGGSETTLNIFDTATDKIVKQIAPIWKHEHFEGGDVWIEGATADPADEGARRAALERACT